MLTKSTTLTKINKIHSIYVYSYSFYFDVDAKFPGINLSIQTHHVHVYKDRFVFLKGENGQKLLKAKANDGIEPGSDGEDGIPGNPGKPGGNFKLDSFS